MEAQIEALMNASPVRALAVAVFEDGKRSFYAWGDFESKPLSPQHVFPVASLTKPLFVYGVLRLIQEGLLDLDQPLQSYLPHPYLENGHYLDMMTARQAMCHTTGFPNWRNTAGLRADFQPGTRFSYSSEGLNYLQIVVEHLLQQSMSNYLRQSIFLPLGMHQSELRPETAQTLSPGLAFLETKLPANGALSLWTSLDDYLLFVQAILEQNALLDGAFYTEMLKPHVKVGDYADLAWGLGWGLQTFKDSLSFWHWGARGIPQTMNFAIAYPQEQKACVVFTNHAEGLLLSQQILVEIFPDRKFPAFEWLLPAKNWRADGLSSLT